MKLPSASEIKRKGDAYFKSRKTIRTDKNGSPVRDEDGNILFGADAPYTMTGYAEAIGLSSVEDLFSFEDEERQLLIKKALLRIEAYAEEHLFNKDSFPGAKLFLSVNFKRWGEKGGEDENIDEETKLTLEKWGK